MYFQKTIFLIAADQIAFGTSNKIPLWLCGVLY